MKTHIIPLLVLILFLSCTKPASIDADIPACIKNMIIQLEKEEQRNPPASIWQMEYNNQIVFYVPPYCCDMYGTVYNTDCEVICHPDGGITGAGDGRCKDFAVKAKKQKLIWQDHR